MILHYASIALAIAISCKSIMLTAADISIHKAYASFQTAVTTDNVEEIIRYAKFFDTLAKENGEKFISKHVALPTNTKVSALLQVQDDKIVPIINKSLARLAAAPITANNVAQMKKDFNILKAWSTWSEQHDPQQVLAPDALKIQNISQIIKQKTEELSTAERLSALTRADKVFAEIIIKTDANKLTPQMLTEAKNALDTFKKISSQLSEQEQQEAQALLSSVDLTSYNSGMEKAYKMRLDCFPDALSLVLKEKTN